METLVEMVRGWLYTCFSRDIVEDKIERCLRVTEEVLELGQSEGMSREEAHALVEQVFNKPIGDPKQELGGVLVTLFAYCAVTHRLPTAEFWREFNRIDTPEVIAIIRAKQVDKITVRSGSMKRMLEADHEG